MGDWTLKFTVDASGLAEANSGVQQLESSIGETANRSQGFAKELKGIKDSMKGLGSDFTMLGAVAGGAIGGLAALAPSLAGNFANLGIAARNLGEAFAPHIAPIIDGITNSLNGLATWVTQNPEAAGWITNILAAVAGLGAASLVFDVADRAWSVLSGLWETGIKIKDLAEPILKGLWETGMTLAKGAWDLISGGLNFAANALSSLSSTITAAFASSGVATALANAGSSFIGALAAGGTLLSGGMAAGLTAIAIGLTGLVVGALGGASVGDWLKKNTGLGGQWYIPEKQGISQTGFGQTPSEKDAVYLGQGWETPIGGWESIKDTGSQQHAIASLAMAQGATTEQILSIYNSLGETSLELSDMKEIMRSGILQSSYKSFFGKEMPANASSVTINMPVTVQGSVTSDHELAQTMMRQMLQALHQFGINIG